MQMNNNVISTEERALPDLNGSALEKTEYHSSSVRETDEIASRFAKIIKGGETILMYGELGAGKTTFTKALFKALGVTDTVTSPTFTLMKTYYGKYTVHHLDMYRIETEEDVEELGLREEIEGSDVTVIEWNKFTDFIGAVYAVSIEYLGENTRKITIALLQKNA